MSMTSHLYLIEIASYGTDNVKIKLIEKALVPYFDSSRSSSRLAQVMIVLQV